MSDQRKTPQKDNTEDDSSNFWIKAAAAVVGGAALTYGAGKLINSLGFEENGIRKGSPASRYQSKTYGGETPKEGLFSSLQRTGTTDLSTAEKVGAGAITSLAIYGVAEMIDQFTSSSQKKE
ncbi:uncharacterized protein LOC129221510 [Uloborus diversus]|uniref:uncharacterized protein LOC129221510 n=1 Tax=Uloborus diversus TaxID=327109 RepID=UPI002409E21D|nr:uncharacterized protein LOC129221510 [Uloborus diversus]